MSELEDLEARRQAMIEHLTRRLATPGVDALCGPCADGAHAGCKSDVYDSLSKTRVPCTCPLRDTPPHP